MKRFNVKFLLLLLSCLVLSFLFLRWHAGGSLNAAAFNLCDQVASSVIFYKDKYGSEPEDLNSLVSEGVVSKETVDWWKREQDRINGNTELLSNEGVVFFLKLKLKKNSYFVVKTSGLVIEIEEPRL